IVEAAMTRASPHRRLEEERRLIAVAFGDGRGLQPALHSEDALLVEDGEELLDGHVAEAEVIDVEVSVGVAAPRDAIEPAVTRVVVLIPIVDGREHLREREVGLRAKAGRGCIGEAILNRGIPGVSATADRRAQSADERSSLEPRERPQDRSPLDLCEVDEVA